MDFELSQEQRMIYEYGNSLVKQFDRKYWLACAEQKRFPQEMYDKVAADGFVGMMVPEAYGGAGQGMTEMHLFLEGLSNHGIPLLSLVVGATMSVGFIAKHGTEEQKKTLSAGCLQRSYALLLCHYRAGCRDQYDPDHIDREEKGGPLFAVRPKGVHL